jgi:hypothetical protein
MSTSMSSPARNPAAIESIERGMFSSAGRCEQGQRRHHDGELRQQHSITLDAEIGANATASRSFGFADFGDVEFWRANRVDYFLHDVPQLEAGEHGLSIHLCEQVKHSNIRHCIAPCSISKQVQQ